VAVMMIFFISDQDWTKIMRAVEQLNALNLAKVIPQLATKADLAALGKKMETEMAEVDDAIAELTAQVDKNADAEASAVAAINRLADLINSKATDPAALRALAAKLKTSADALGAAIANEEGA
jgi:aminopeptidase N